MKIFLSSTSKDLTDYREAVREAILDLDHMPVAMENFPAADATPLEESLARVAECDVYVGIIARRYGFVPAGCEQSMTELEYRYAERRGIPRLIFLLDDDCLWPDEFTDTGDAADRLESFRRILRRDRVVHPFRDDPYQLAQKVSAAIHHYVTDRMAKEHADAQKMSAEDQIRQETAVAREQAEQETAARQRGTRRRERVVGPVPTAALQHFQDRVAELRVLHDRVRDVSLRAVLVCGQGGIGKTALVTKLIRELEGDFSEDTRDQTDGVDSVVYIALRDSESRSPDKIVDLVCRTLEPQEAEGVSRAWAGKSSLAEGLEMLFRQALGKHRRLIVLDNLESVLDQHDQIPEEYRPLAEFIEACLEYDHAAIVLATSRRALTLSPELAGRTGSRREDVVLETGLPPAEAIELLRALDRDGMLGLRAARTEVLTGLAQRSQGVPRVLESVVGWLRQHPTWTLDRLLDDDAELGRLLDNPARELYESQPSDKERLVLQALSIYSRPVSAAAVRHLLPALPVDEILDALVRNYVVSHDRGRFSLHPLDQHYAYRQIPEAGESYSRKAMHCQANEFFGRTSVARAEWRSIDDLDAQLQQFYHLTQAELWDAAAEVLEAVDRHYLWQWGYADLVIEMREELRGRLSSRHAEMSNLAGLAWAYWSQGMLDRALAAYDAAIAIADEVSPWEAGAFRHNKALACMALGRIEEALALMREGARGGANSPAGQGDEGIALLWTGSTLDAIQLFREALRRAADVGDKRIEANNLDNLALAHLHLGQYEQAIEYSTRSIQYPVEVLSTYNMAVHLHTRARAHLMLGHYEAAEADCRQALALGEPAQRPRAGLYASVATAFLGDVTGALTQARQVVEWAQSLVAHARHNWNARYVLAAALLLADRTHDAMAEYREALRCCNAKGVVADALIDLRVLEALRPAPSGLAEALALLESSATG